MVISILSTSAEWVRFGSISFGDDLPDDLDSSAHASAEINIDDSAILNLREGLLVKLDAQENRLQLSSKRL